MNYGNQNLNLFSDLESSLLDNLYIRRLIAKYAFVINNSPIF